MEIPTRFGPLPGFALPADARLYRIYRHVDADWSVAPEPHRKGRVDPPLPDSSAYGLLYLADSLVTAGFEARILRPTKDADGLNDISIEPEPMDLVTGRALKPPPMTAVHTTKQPIVFVDLESPDIARAAAIAIGRPVPRIEKWRKLTLWVHDQLIVTGDGNSILPLVGVTYISNLPDCTGRNFVVFEGRRDAHIHRGVPPESQTPLDVPGLQALWENA